MSLENFSLMGLKRVALALKFLLPRAGGRLSIKGSCDSDLPREGDKLARALALQPMFSQGLIYAPKNATTAEDRPGSVSCSLPIRSCRCP